MPSYEIHTQHGIGNKQLIAFLAAFVVIFIGAFYLFNQRSDGAGMDDEGGEPPANGQRTPPESNRPPPDGSEPETDGPEDRRTVKPGEEVHRVVFEGELSEPMTAINNVARMKEIFRENTLYRKEGLATISGRASHQDWGIEGFADFSMNVLGIAEVLIMENDGRSVIAQVDMIESSVTEFRAEPGARVDLGRRFHNLFDIGALIMGPVEGFTVPPGTSRISERMLNHYLDKPETRGALRFLLESDSPLNPGMMKLMGLIISPPEIGGLHGTRFEVHYEDGKGVQKVIFVGPLDGFERATAGGEDLVFLDDVHYLFQAGLFGDAHLFPDRPLSDGELHNVQADAIPAPFPASWRVRQRGMISFGRYDESNQRGEIYYRRGQFEAQGRPEGRDIRGTFTPNEGTIHFYTDPQQMDRFHLQGDVSFTDRSTGHWIFEARHQVTPKFEIQYQVSIIDN